LDVFGVLTFSPYHRYFVTSCTKRPRGLA
jgi:hypothetical protein